MFVSAASGRCLRQIIEDLILSVSTSARCTAASHPAYRPWTTSAICLITSSSPSVSSHGQIMKTLYGGVWPPEIPVTYSAVSWWRSSMKPIAWTRLNACISSSWRTTRVISITLDWRRGQNYLGHKLYHSDMYRTLDSKENDVCPSVLCNDRPNIHIP